MNLTLYLRQSHGSSQGSSQVGTWPRCESQRTFGQIYKRVSMVQYRAMRLLTKTRQLAKGKACVEEMDQANSVQRIESVFCTVIFS